jgi:glycosyltransferase involved in cell wall biosynthesis
MLAGSKSRVVPVEHMPVNVDRRENPNLLVKIAYGMYPIAYRFTPVVVVNCHDSAAAFRREFPGLAALVRVIYNPVVSTDLATLIDESIEEGPLASIENRPAVLLGAGRLTRQKNFALLLRAFALVRERRECELVIIGDRGEEKERLRRLAADLGVSQHLHWPGFVANPYAYFSRASIFVLSSIYETLPTVLVEAIACGTPAVATNCFGVNEILEGDRFGTIVEDFEPTTLAEAILATLDRPISREALKTGARKFSVSASADKYEALVQELMA